MKITLADGQQAYVYTAGQSLDNERPAVVFVHGAQNDHSVWALQSRYFANHGFRVLAVDLPGHGSSTGTPLTSIDAMADWIAEVMAAAGVASAAVVGHSMGSLIALAFSMRHPERCAAIALVGSAFPMAVSDALLEAASSDEAKAIDMICNWSHSGLTFLPGNPGFSVFMMSKRLMQRQRPGVLAVDFNACNNWTEGMQAAQACKVPALLVSGANDMMTPARAISQVYQALQEQAGTNGLQAPRHEIIGQCGHAIMSEQPTALLQVLRQFIPGTVAASPAP